MNIATPLIKPPPPPRAGNPRSAMPGTRAAHSETSTVDDLLVDLPLIGTMPYGLPSVIFLAGWVFFALALTGPFLVLVIVALATVIIVVLTGAIVALLYLIARRPHRFRRHEHHPVGDNCPIERRGGGLINTPASSLPAAVHLPAAVRLRTSAQDPFTRK
jgi:hypothetical protein